MIRASERCVAAALWLLPAVALAQPGDDSIARSEQEKRTARELYQLGNERYGKGDYAGAAEAFRGAHRIMGVPTTALGLGKALAKMGQLLESREALLAVASYPTEAGEPESFGLARTEAQALADELALRIPTLEVVVNAADPQVTVDGVPAEKQRQPLNPGTHVVQVTAPGHVPTALRVELGERETRVVQVVLARVPPPPPPPPPALPLPRPPAPTAPPEDATALAVAIASFAVAGAGILVGGITGAVSLGAAAELEELCDANKTCPPSAEDTRERSLTAAHVSTGAFVVGGLGLAAGIIAVVLHADQPAHGTRGARWHLGAGSIALSGDF